MKPYPGTVYLLHIEPPLHHAAHYAGWTADTDPTRRIGEHLAGRFKPDANGALRYVGTGSPLVAAALATGRRVDLVLAVPGDRGLERKWHNAHGTRVCPRCHSQRPPRPRQLRLPIRTNREDRYPRSSPTPLWRVRHAA